MRKKYINKEGNIPKMKRLPKTHKEEIGMRSMVNGKGTILEQLEAEIAKVIKVLESQQEKKMLKNSEEMIVNWKNVHQR